ncbi:hypothetical protein R1sor_009275 [Riccia sorocarpa]|uniref:Uncharacterized protein n=1 Tax=Riccia sorocarpa TaxID=122646 RepID=A0ABD3HWP9_9MARC
MTLRDFGEICLLVYRSPRGCGAVRSGLNRRLKGLARILLTLKCRDSSACAPRRVGWSSRLSVASLFRWGWWASEMFFLLWSEMAGAVGSL